MAETKGTHATVLISMDGSEYADYAFDWFLKNVHRPDDTVVLFNCVEFHTVTNMPLGIGSAELMTTMMNEQKASADKYLHVLTDKMKKANLRGKVCQVHGAPRSEIIHAAEKEKATMIVTGTRGMGTVRRTFLGSVSDHVLHHSHVPVLICKHPDDHVKHGKQSK